MPELSNKEELQRKINKVLPKVLENAKAARAANKTIPISGERFTLPLEGRDIDIAYYRADVPNAPLFIGLHGGGFLFGGSAMDDELWTNIVKELDVNVASIDYRQSPDVKDFDCLYDAYDSALYLIAHSEEFGFDKNHVSTFGSSAGGNLSAAVALLAGQRGDLKLDNQIMMYPFLDGYTNPDAKGHGSFEGLLPHIMNYLHFSDEHARNPLISPYYATKKMLTGLPNAIVSYCDLDNLRPEAVKYCEMLKEAGVPVAEYFAKNMPHGYIEFGFKNEFSEVELGMMGDKKDEYINGGTLKIAAQETLKFIKREMVR